MSSRYQECPACEGGVRVPLLGEPLVCPACNGKGILLVEDWRVAHFLPSSTGPMPPEHNQN